MKVVKIAQKPTYINWKETDDIKRMYKEIGCHLVQFVDLPKISELVFPKGEYTVTMICDEEGKLTDRPLFNTKATALWMYEYGETDVIAGKVLLMKCDDEGNTLPFTDNDLFRLKQVINHRVINEATNRILVKLVMSGHCVF